MVKTRPKPALMWQIFCNFVVDLPEFMIYPENIEKKIGFDAVRRMVADLCGSPLSKQLAAEAAFSTDFSQIDAELRRVAEFKTIIETDPDFPGIAFRDITARLKAIRPEGTFLTAEEFIDLGLSLTAMTALASYFARQRSDQGESPYPNLDALADQIMVFPAISAAISRTFDRWGQIKDNASPELADIRRRLSGMSGSINAAMRRVVENARRDGILDADAAPSMRDGRLVLPVSPMFKRRIPGIVHDESASGKTIFIEPAEVVEANNRMRELHLEQHREEVKILTALTTDLRPQLDVILASFDTLARFDFIHAKAQFAIQSDASLPHLSRNPQLEWYHACHPVLRESLQRQQRQIVPLDIRLTAPDNRILVISGPNAGGKSVVLKTVAICQYMLQCGILPPVYNNSHFGIFSGIFIDIGDDQSIEDDLSTYSSHLRNMRFLLNAGGSRTLMLIDEFGSGTEPQIGGAIAQALLADFNTAGMWGVVSTHFQNLKKFAEDTPGLVNGSMLYDRQKMQPLFTLAIGHPGSSFAIEIARKTGLPDKIIDAAGQLVGSDYLNLDKYLLDIARDRRYWENKRIEIRRKEKQLEQTLEQYSADADSLRQHRREIIADAREEARKILEGSNAAIERTIHDIRRAQADREKTLEARRRLAQERHELTDGHTDDHPLIPKIKTTKKAKQAPKPIEKPKELAPGDNVLLDGSGTVGTIEAIRGKEAVVIFGQMKTTVKLQRLSPTDRKPKSATQKAASFISVETSNDNRERQLRFRPEIDVRGMRADEALQAVTYFIDDAVQFAQQRVRILHGTGTGALRQCIRQYLATVPAVVHFADEDVRFGGAGITVVEF